MVCDRMLPYAVLILPCGVVRLYLNSEMDGGSAVGLVVLSAVIAGLRKVVSRWTDIERKVILTHGLLELVQVLLFLICMMGTTVRYLYFAMTSTVICFISQINTFNSRLTNALFIIKHFVLWFSFSSAEVGLPFPYCLVLFTVAMMLLRVNHYSQLARDRHNRTQAVIEEEQKLRNLLQAIPDGVLVLSCCGKTLCWNASLVTMLNTDEGALSKTVNRLQLDNGEGLIHAAKRYITKPLTENSLGVVRVEGLSLEWKASHCTWGQTKACILTARDISAWQEMQVRLKQESALKTALIRSVSHELRTPTNAIINLVRDIADTVPIAFKKDLEVVTICSHFLLSMINDLLDSSKVLAGKFTLVKAKFDLMAELEFVIRLFRPQTASKGIDLRLNIDPFLTKYAYTDCTRLQQILLNLLSNAVKFTSKGSIRLTASQVTSCQVQFSVSDTGIGIPPEKHRSIFQLYGKVEGNEELNPQGNGLGLGISNMLANELGGGDIALVSTEGKGSTFSFVIETEELTPSEPPQDSSPCESEEADIAVESTPYALPDFPSDNTQSVYCPVLIVDDSEFNRLVLGKMLRSYGVQAAEAGTGREAVEMVRKGLRKYQIYRLVFMDLDMPEMNGLEATTEILPLLRQFPSPIRTEIIACSAYSSEEDKQSCLQVGMVHYLEKPISREAVGRCLLQAQLITQ